MAALKEIVIVGASLAGLRAAEALRGQGYEGRLTLVGAEAHLPYDRPPLSKEVLAGAWEPEKASLVKPEALEKLELELHLSRRAKSLDGKQRRVELEGGASLQYEGLILATGASPRRLSGSPALKGIYTLRTLDDCLAIAAELEAGPRVAVVGSGFIGAEVAATCRKRGLDVSLIDVLDEPMGPVLGAEVGRSLAAEHADRGVALHLGTGVAGFEGDGRVERVRLDDGRAIDADIVVVGIGVTPETGWLEGSGIELDDGVVCDASCASSVPGVVAAGDVASWYHPVFERRMRVEHWSNAVEQGRAAALRLLAGAENPEPYDAIPFFWSDQYDLKIQACGDLHDCDERRVVHGSLEERRFLQLYGRRGRLVGALAFNEPRRVMGYRRSLRDTSSFEDAVAEASA